MNGWLTLASLGVLAAAYAADRLIAARRTRDAILAEAREENPE